MHLSRIHCVLCTLSYTILKYNAVHSVGIPVPYFKTLQFRANTIPANFENQPNPCKLRNTGKNKNQIALTAKNKLNRMETILILLNHSFGTTLT